MFDLGFFEEIEDLKYSYAKLKREAETFARGKVWNSHLPVKWNKDCKTVPLQALLSEAKNAR